MQSKTDGPGHVTRAEEFLFTCIFRSLLVLIINNIISTLQLRTLGGRQTKLLAHYSKYGWS